MSKKQKFKDITGILFSTDPEFNYTPESQDEMATLPPRDQNLRIWLDRKHRGGKTATIIKGFEGTTDDMNSLARMLKQHCGVGGNAKDEEIIIQGDQRNKVLKWLLDNGYSRTKLAGN